ncbi:unnamed protein product [Nezara viridula]|uniref:Box C/D snoRNA protein 1 n=1 Tax=Nezara viridula TaxID=85310 RepID=A0A9P0E0Z9_NEZVI|nr:unnamed protein product [Nezara viridula]
MPVEISNSRLGNCEVCAINPAKYTCPGCEVKTCCLQCVKIHKKELECSGIRNKVKFKQIQKMNALDLQSDYLLLENATRSVDSVVNNGKGLRKANFYSMARMKIKNAANKRNIDLHYLPKSFSRHRKNSTYYHWKSDKLFWKVEWIFTEADMFSIVDERVPEEELVSNVLDKYLKFETCDLNLKKLLKPYLEADEKDILVLLKLEKYGTKAFIEVDTNDSLMENLSLQSIIEYPIFYVIFRRSSSEYNILKRDNRSLKFSNNYKGTNLLFGSVEGKPL